MGVLSIRKLIVVANIKRKPVRLTGRIVAAKKTVRWSENRYDKNRFQPIAVGDI